MRLCSIEQGYVRRFSFLNFHVQRAEGSVFQGFQSCVNCLDASADPVVDKGSSFGVKFLLGHFHTSDQS